jgi:hypothetical protein
MLLQRNNKTNQNPASGLITLNINKTAEGKPGQPVPATPSGKTLAPVTLTAWSCTSCMLSFLMPYAYNFIWDLVFWWLWRRVVCQMFGNVSEEEAASIFMADEFLLSWSGGLVIIHYARKQLPDYTMSHRKRQYFSSKKANFSCVYLINNYAMKMYGEWRYSSTILVLDKRRT